MQLKKFGVLVPAVLVLSAVAAGNSYAAKPVLVAAPWTTETAGHVLVGTKNATASQVAGTSSSFTTEISGQEVELVTSTAPSSVECLSCSIENVGGEAVGKGRIKFNNVTEPKPAGCQVKGGVIATEPLKVNADYMNTATGSVAYESFAPANVITGFAVITLEKKSEKTCPISGSYVVDGEIYGQATLETTKLANPQEVSFSPHIENVTEEHLKVGTVEAHLTSRVDFSVGTPLGVN